MVINFFGRRGSGKTTAIRGNLKDCRPPIVIVDVLGNFENPEYVQSNDLSECILEIKNNLKERKKNPAKKLIINLKTADPTLAADYLSSVIWEIEGGTLILDEIDAVKIKEGSCFDQYIRYGRNHSGDLITGCRRPAEIHRSITAAANKFYCFQTHEIRDIEYFYSIFGDKAEELMRSPQYSGHFMDYDSSLTGKFRIDINGLIYHTEEISTHSHE